jgi:hypothetical protein
LINDKLNVLKNIYKSNPNEINRPSLIILCPIANRMPRELINGFRNTAQQFRNNLINNQDLRNYFSNIEIVVLSPLTENIHNIIVESSKFRVADIDESNLREVQEVLNQIKNKNNPGKLGSNFKNLNIFYEMASKNRIIDAITLDQSIKYIQNLMDQISSNWNIFNGNYNLLLLY